MDSTSFGALARQYPLLVPSSYLAVSLVGGLFALNAHRPLLRKGRLSLSVVFFAGWLTTELPLHHVVWQLAVTAVFVRMGALGSWLGWVGLGVTLMSWAALVDLFVEARQVGTIVERSLVEALGSDYRERIAPELRAGLEGGPTFGEILRPFHWGSAEVERIRNLPYGEFGKRNRLDIYRRRDHATAGAPAPVLVTVHGGAWVIGAKEQQAQPLIHHLAALGWVCVAINYRLSPRATFPEHIVDVKRALAWVKAHVAEYGGDPDFVVISGGSAGGHLSSLAALTAGDPAFQPGFADADTSVRACVPFYGVYDFTNRGGHGRSDLVSFLERLVMKRQLVEARDAFEAASPMSRVHADAPPFLVVHGLNDTLVPVTQARLFVELLRGVSRREVAYVELPRAQHAFEVFSSVRTAHVIRGVARFLSVLWSEHRARAGNRLAVPRPVVVAEPLVEEAVAAEGAAVTIAPASG